MSTPDLDSVYTITHGAGGLPRLTLTAADGARADIYLHGAHVTSWAPAGRQERLFLSQRSQFRPGAPIRGGIPVCFPQFGGLGPLPLHGLARLMSWEFIGAREMDECASVTFRLRDSEESRSLWPYLFLAELVVTVGGNRLEVMLNVTNTGAKPFDFTTALHTYLRVANIQGTSVKGLAGLRYRDAADGGIEKQDESQQVDFSGEVNRIYFTTPAEATLIEPDRVTVIRKTGFTDTVVWNPAEAKCATMPDLEPADYRDFVCVEAATVGIPIQLDAGHAWVGRQEILT